MCTNILGGHCYQQTAMAAAGCNSLVFGGRLLQKSNLNRICDQQHRPCLVTGQCAGHPKPLNFPNSSWTIEHRCSPFSADAFCTWACYAASLAHVFECSSVVSKWLLSLQAFAAFCSRTQLLGVGRRPQAVTMNAAQLPAALWAMTARLP